MSERTRYEQYLICQERGHVPSGMRATSSPPQDICKHCGTYYRWHVEKTLVECMTPKAE